MLWRAAEGEEGYALKYARWTAVPGSEETVEQLMDERGVVPEAGVRYRKIPAPEKETNF